MARQTSDTTSSDDLEARVATLESRLQAVASDAARDRDISGLTVRVDANRSAITTLIERQGGETSK